MAYQLTERTIGGFLEYWAEKTPDKEYLVYSDRDLRFTYKQFNERVDNMAKGLMSIGVRRGSHVGIWATNVPDWLTFLYATAKLGAVAVTDGDGKGVDSRAGNKADRLLGRGIHITRLIISRICLTYVTYLSLNGSAHGVSYAHYLTGILEIFLNARCRSVKHYA